MKLKEFRPWGHPSRPFRSATARAGMRGESEICRCRSATNTFFNGSFRHPLLQGRNQYDYFVGITTYSSFPIIHKVGKLGI